ncbi:MAG: hypothetical protein NC122_10210 [Faecalibacterium sp.]|nr:hypothetical protein [Ruminococcus sp.]MCM1393031.1 hypothetical protein [Ruminococcus sp.]MCM1486564.1 hypothetical protein [Faecalibacterium sp.]
MNSRLNIDKNKIIIKPRKSDTAQLVIIYLLFAVVTAAIVSVAVQDKTVTAILFSIIMAVIGIASIIKDFPNISTLTIDQNGIKSKLLFAEKQITWNELQDFGFSYYAETRYDGELFNLYFSGETLETGKNGKKKLNGKTIRAYVHDDEYDTFESEVISFCRKYTSLLPYDTHVRNYKM